MTRQPSVQGTDAFARKLEKLHRDCLSPSYRKLAEISGQLKQIYPDFEGDLPQLTPAAISEVRNGKRKNLPKAAWLASYVLSHQRWASQMWPDSKDPGLDSLSEWYEALVAAQEGRAGVPDESAGDSISPGRLTRRCPPNTVRLTPAQRTLLARYGPHGLDLLGQVHAGQPDAVYRAALLLAADPAHAQEAPPLLVHAGAAGHPAALDLLDANGGCPGPLDAARHACRIADTAKASGSREEALVYYECAAKARSARHHPDSASTKSTGLPPGGR